MRAIRCNMGILSIIALWAVIPLLGGCCTTKCCVSEQCRAPAMCEKSLVRSMTLVDDRLTKCPNTWSQGFFVMPGDTVEIFNCATKDARLTFNPPGMFNEGTAFNVAAGKRISLTVSSGLQAGRIASLVIEAEGACSHPGSGVIVRDGP